MEERSTDRKGREGGRARKRELREKGRKES